MNKFSTIWKTNIMEIQRGNCASILGTVESPTLLNELFELFDTKSDHYHS